jgi:hypothetical protein
VQVGSDEPKRQNVGKASLQPPALDQDGRALLHELQFRTEADVKEQSSRWRSRHGCHEMKSPQRDFGRVRVTTTTRSLPRWVSLHAITFPDNETTGRGQWANGK